MACRVRSLRDRKLFIWTSEHPSPAKECLPSNTAMMLGSSTLSELVAGRLSEFLVHEARILSNVESRVEDIERELMHIQAFLKDVESRGHGDKEHAWQARFQNLALNAEDVIQTFVDISVQRRSWIFSLVNRYKVGKELDIIRQRVKEISHEIMNCSPSQQKTNRDVVEVTVNVFSPKTEQDPAAAVDKFSSILSQDLIDDYGVKMIVQEVRDEVVSMLNVVSNLKSKEESSEREKVWLEEVDNVTSFIIRVTEGFITRATTRTTTRHSFRKGILLCFLPFFRIYTDMPLRSSERKLMREMEYIKTQVRGALRRRRLTCVVGEEEEDEEEEEDVGDKISMLRFPPSPLELIRVVITTSNFFIRSIISIMIRSEEHNFESTPAYIALESIKRDLALMHALLKDIRGVEGLNKRQQVWIEQIREVVGQAETLLAAYEPRMNQYSWFVWRLFQHVVPSLICDEGISDMLYKMNKIWERTSIYDIANIEGRKSIVSEGQSMQGNGSGSERQHNDNSGNGEDPPLSAGMSNNYRLVEGYTKEAVLSIRGELELMNALFDDAEQMGELDGRSKIWLDQMKYIATEIKSVIYYYASRWEDQPIHARIFNIPALYDINLKINQIRNRIQEIRRMRKRYGSNHIQTLAQSSSSEVHRLHGKTQPPLNVRESNTIGVDMDVEVLMEKLLDENNSCIISIIGIEGIGKKELAKLIFHNAAIKEHFDHRVCISAREGSVKRVEDGKNKQIMSDEEAMLTGKEDSTQTLETFMKMKRRLCLIVVEDIGVETPIVWDTLKKTIPDMSTGCRLLLTSRNAKVAELHAGPRSFVHHMLLLDDENSWVLFERNLKADTPDNLMKVAKDIATKCGGLPSEILKIGKELSKKDGNEWSSMLQELNQYRKPWSETLNTIETLPVHLMRCLSYFVLLPAEFDIPTRRLIVLWVAEGLVHQRKKQPPEQVAERYLSELINLNMVQIAKRKRNGKVKTCRLPNALRESPFLQRRLSITLVEEHPSTSSGSVRKRPIIRQLPDRLNKNDICHDHIHSDTTIASASLKSSYMNVLSFLSFDTQEGSKPGQDVGKFINRCISSSCFLLLLVLDLEGVYKPQLPENIARLYQLRYLGLRWTYLESLPSSISSLLKLQTLDLKHTYISILTSSIWKMQLRHLFLSETYRSRFPPHPRGNSLSDLQTLWGLFVDEKTPVKGGLDRLVNIRKLGLACQSMSLGEEKMTQQLHTVAAWIRKLKYLQSLRLKSRKENGQPGDLYLGYLETHADLTDMYLSGVLQSSSIKSIFPPSLIELTLSHSELREDSIGILGDLPKLQSLCLLAGSYTGETLHCRKGSFPQLHVLKLWKLEKIKEWTIEEGALPCLRQLEIKSWCECLEMLPGGLKHVNTLLELKLTNMPESFDNGVDKDKLPRFCRVTKLPVSSN